MNNRNLLNLALLVVVAVLLLTVIFAPDNAPPPAPTLLGGDGAQINSIDIRFAGRSVHFDKLGGHWLMTAPYQHPANDVQLASMLEMFRVHALSRFAVGDTPAKYGFDAQAVTVKFNDIDLQFGASDPLQNRRYVLYRNEIVLIDNDLRYLFNQAPESYLYRGLLPAGAEPVAFHLPGLELQKTDSGWTATGATYTQEQIAHLVDEWRFSQASLISPWDKTQGKKLEVDLQDGSRLQFQLFNKERETLLARPDLGVQYHFASDIGDRLLRPQTEPKPEPAP